MLVHVLVVAERSADAVRLRALLGGAGTHVSTLSAGASVWAHAGSELLDLVVIQRDLLPEPIVRTVRTIRDLPASPEVIVVSSREDAGERAELLAAGCLAVLDGTLGDAPLRESFASLVERRRGESSARLGATAGGQRLGDFVSSSPTMRELLRTARRVATSDTTLLVLGETGTGKEWLARGIHAEGARSHRAFLAVNCGAIPDGLLESELFGHRRGAFTGATGDRRGHFELAHGGTLFLDEIAEMPPQVQVKLLRALQEKTIRPVGGERPIEVDVRLVAATNRDPVREMMAGTLRKDLYYRIGVVTLTIPPLRERREDIPDLVENYFEIYRVRLGRMVYGIAREAMAALVEYDWPGNVRELINVMERAVLLAPGEEITLADLPAPINGGGRSPFAAAPVFAATEEGLLDPSWTRMPLPEARREAARLFERHYLTTLLTESGGRIGETARRAGISPRALFDRMRQLGLRKEDYSPAASSRGR